MRNMKMPVEAILEPADEDMTLIDISNETLPVEV